MAESSDSFFSSRSHNQVSQEAGDFSLDGDTVNIFDYDHDDIDELLQGIPTESDSEQSDNLSGASNPQNSNVGPMSARASGGERAPKRRRLNNGAASRPGGSRETSIDLTADAVPMYSAYGSNLPPSRLNLNSFADSTADSRSSTEYGQTPRNNPPNADTGMLSQLIEINGNNLIHDRSAPGSTRDVATQATGAAPRAPNPPEDRHDAGGLEAIDLTGVVDMASLRQRQQFDDEQRRMKREASMKIEARRKANEQMLRSTLAAQQAADPKNPSEHKGLGAMQCVICMDSFTDMTATHCGHLFCHTCINEHLITAEMSIVHKDSLCPFCRQPIVRIPSKNKERDKTIVPLSFKVKQKEANKDKGKQKEVQLPD